LDEVAHGHPGRRSVRGQGGPIPGGEVCVARVAGRVAPGWPQGGPGWPGGQGGRGVQGVPHPGCPQALEGLEKAFGAVGSALATLWTLLTALGTLGAVMRRPAPRSAALARRLGTPREFCAHWPEAMRPRALATGW